MVGTLVAPRKASLRLFHAGWGDPDLYTYYRTVEARPPVDFDLDVRWDRIIADPAGGRIWDGRYVSLAEHLPDASRTARARLLIPAFGYRRLCLLMSAWNDHGFVDRAPLARRLAARGIATLMFENPYFGHRRPLDGTQHPVATAVDFAVMGYSTVDEGRALLRWLRDHGAPGQSDDGATLGVAGFSMGGNIAGAISAMAPFPVATASLAGSYSPGPLFSDGVMERVVDWTALSDREDARDELVAFLSRMSVLNYPPPPHAASAVFLGGIADGFVPPRLVQDFHRHWPGSELRWTNEGHATLRLLRSPSLSRAVSDAFTRFEAAYHTQANQTLGLDD